MTDPARDTLTRAIERATNQVSQATGQALRSIAGGTNWNDPYLATLREKLRRALADLAIARHLLRELDALDAATAPKAVRP